MPDTLKSLDTYAFYGNINAEYLYLSTNSAFTVIPEAAFAYCVSLVNGSANGTSLTNYDITIPSNIVEIKTNAFAYCESIYYLHFKKELNLINAKAFDYCHNLERIYYNETKNYRETKPLTIENSTASVAKTNKMGNVYVLEAEWIYERRILCR